MIKKVIFGFIAATALLLCSCGSTKTETPSQVTQPEPPAAEISEETEQTEQAEVDNSEEAVQPQDETNESTDEDLEQNNSESDINIEAAAENTEENQDEDLQNELYPPLEEIEEPSVTELSPEDFYKQPEQPEEAPKIEEPVPQEEVTPPVLENLTLEEFTDELTSPNLTADNESQENEEQLDSQNEAAEENDSDQESDEEQTEEPEEEIVIVPSRSVTLKKGETLSVTYPGNGWIYMGSTSEYNNLASRGRKLGSTDTKYTLLAKEAGTQIHHFYKTDNLTGEYIDDYLEVTVLDKKGKSTTVVEAPDYKDTVPKKPEKPAKSSETKKKELEQKMEQQQEQEKSAEAVTQEAATKPTDSAEKTEPKPQKQTQNSTNKQKAKPQPKQEEETIIVVDGDDSVIEVETQEEDDTPQEDIIDIASLMEEAKNAIKSKKYGDAYSTLTKYLEYSTDSRDEALFLLGQILESESKFRNIKEAVNTYQSLCDNYPASEYWDRANKRIIYLKRFYINIH